jgi:hypothetical protein
MHIVLARICSVLSGLESREYGRRDPSRWPRGTLRPQNLALTSPTSVSQLVSIARSHTQAAVFLLLLLLFLVFSISISYALVLTHNTKAFFRWNGVQISTTVPHGISRCTEIRVTLSECIYIAETAKFHCVPLIEHDPQVRLLCGGPGPLVSGIVSVYWRS